MGPSAITNNQIQTIWSTHGLGEVLDLTPITSGSRNLAFYVNHDYVLRINTRDPHLPKFRNEKAALDMLDGAGLPVPTVILLDESHRLIPHDYIALNRLPGVSIAESKDNLSETLAQRLAFESGRFLAGSTNSLLTPLEILRISKGSPSLIGRPSSRTTPHATWPRPTSLAWSAPKCGSASQRIYPDETLPRQG